MSKTNTVSDRDLIYQLEGRPSLAIALPIGLQHVLAMFTGNLAPVLILIGLFKETMPVDQQISIIQCAMLVSGLTSMVQLYPIKLPGGYRIGASLPIVMGTSFAFVPTIQSLAGGDNPYSLAAILGAALVASLVEVVMGFFYKPLEKLFPPIVVGSTLVAIGINLLQVGVNYFAGGGVKASNPNYGSPQNLTLAFITLIVIIGLQRFGKGMWKVSAILIGLIVGYIVALIMGAVNLQVIADARWIDLPFPKILPWQLEFHPSAILAFASIFVVSGLETIGNVSGITIAGFNREATTEETSGGILADALGSTVATLFNALPNTAFGQNAGIVSMTKVVNKFCVATGASILILAAFFPKIGAIFNAMPASVLGGAVITVFAMILINGIKMLSKEKITDRDVLILALTFGLGLGLGRYPDAIAGLPAFIRTTIFHDGVSSCCIISIIANLVFPKGK